MPILSHKFNFMTSIESLWPIVRRELNVGIVFFCSNAEAIDIYQFSITRLLPAFIKSKLIKQLVGKIDEENRVDDIHLIPIATHVPGGAIFDVEMMKRDLSYLRDHLKENWQIVIIETGEINGKYTVESDTENNLVEYLGPSSKTNISKHSVIDNILKLLGDYYPDKTDEEARQTISLNLKAEKPIPFSIYKYILDYSTSKDLVWITDAKYEIYLSPGYNLRIIAPGIAELQIMIDKMGPVWGGKKYTDIATSSSNANKKNYTFSIFHLNVFNFFLCIGVPISVIEFIYKIRFLAYKYHLKPANKLNQFIKKGPRKELQSQSFDLQLCPQGLRIDGNRNIITLEQFETQRLYETPVGLSKKHFLNKTGVPEYNIVNVIRLLAKYIFKYYSYALLPSEDVVAGYRQIPYLPDINRTWVPPDSIIHDTESILAHITTFGNSTAAIHSIVEVYYQAFTQIIHVTCVNSLLAQKFEDFHDFNTSKLYNFILYQIDRSRTTMDLSISVYILWLYSELALLSFLKGNFYLYYIIVHALHQTKNTCGAIDYILDHVKDRYIFKHLLRIILNNELFEHSTSDDGLKSAIDATAMQYIHVRRMIIFPHPCTTDNALLESAIESLKDLAAKPLALVGLVGYIENNPAKFLDTPDRAAVPEFDSAANKFAKLLSTHSIANEIASILYQRHKKTENCIASLRNVAFAPEAMVTAAWDKAIVKRDVVRATRLLYYNLVFRSLTESKARELDRAFGRELFTVPNDNIDE